MLNLLSTRTVLPFLALLTINVGCGKKIQEETKAASGRSDQNLELSSTPGITVNSLEPRGEVYELLKDGSFILPDQLLVQKGQPVANSEVKIVFNRVDEDDYEFHCLYRYPGSGNRYNFLRCENPDERDLGVDAEDLTYTRWTMDLGKTIVIDFNGTKPSTEVRVQAIFNADWN